MKGFENWFVILIEIIKIISIIIEKVGIKWEIEGELSNTHLLNRWLSVVAVKYSKYKKILLIFNLEIIL